MPIAPFRHQGIYCVSVSSRNKLSLKWCFLLRIIWSMLQKNGPLETCKHKHLWHTCDISLDQNREIGAKKSGDWLWNREIFSRQNLTRFCLKFYIKTPQNVFFFIICDTSLANCSKSYLQYCRGSLLYNLFSRKAAWLIVKSVNLWLYLLSNCVLCCFYVADPAWVIFLSLIYREMC